MLDDLALDAVQWIRHDLRQRTVSQPVAGLAGDVQQHLGRASHQIELAGVLIGEGVRDTLSDLQDKIATGEELSFSADMTTALELERVVVVAAEIQELAGQPDRFEFRLLLRESPPLPEPAELSPFGGLDGLDLGFDTDILGDIADMAGDLQDAIDTVNDVLGQLEALAALGDLGLDNPLSPIQDQAGRIAEVGAGAVGAASALSSLLGGS